MGLWYVEGRGYLCVNGDKVIIIKNNKRYTLQAMEPGEPCVVVDIEPYELSQKKHPGIYLRARGAKML